MDMDWLIATFDGMMAFYGVAWIFVFVFFGFAVFFFVKWLRAIGREDDNRWWIEEHKEDLENIKDKIVELLRKH